MYVLKNLSCCLEWVFLPPAVTSWPWVPSCCLRGPLMENLCVCLAFCSVRWRAHLVVGEGGDSSILETSCRLAAVIFLTQQAPVSVQGWSTCYLAPVDPLFPSCFLPSAVCPISNHSNSRSILPSSSPSLKPIGVAVSTTLAHLIFENRPKDGLIWSHSYLRKHVVWKGRGKRPEHHVLLLNSCRFLAGALGYKMVPSMDLGSDPAKQLLKADQDSLLLFCSSWVIWL